MIILSIFIGICILQLGYWVLIFSQGPRDIDQKTNVAKQEGVSVIIAIKNEEENLPFLLKALKNQDTVNFEVIVANDYSTDKSDDILRQYEISLNLHHFTPSQNLPGKKWALKEAINKSKYDVLLFTDGDCIPHSNYWISNMLYYLSDKSICLGYGPLHGKGAAGFIAKMESIWIAIQYFSYTTIGLPYMAVGRNLMYRKQLFNKEGGYDKHLNLASGDDDLLIRDIAKSNNVSINIDPKSWVYSNAPSSFSELFRQKQRHLSTAFEYSSKIKGLLSLFAILHLACYFFFLIGLFSPLWKGFIFILIAKWMVQSAIHIKWSTLMKGSNYLLLFPIIEAILALYYLCLSPFLWIRKRKSW